ncbi:MAG TPA: hypothetical protein PLE45_04910 [Spirochaetota bacterium]|nr:hypothetical protein [Spirochaetota bacterium]HOL57382.1 hypothetical protein [Spirochaetota bacterium]HPP03878.1 hypothetical protein [Spirochaetota bacterium]
MIIDVFHLPESQIELKLKLIEKVENFKFNFIDISKEPYNITKNCEIIIFEEEYSYISSVDTFDNIIKLYEVFPAVIIITAGRDMFNVVRWMRKGASDCVWIGDFTHEILKNSIRGSLQYVSAKKIGVNKDFRVEDEDFNYSHQKIIIPTNYDWNSLEDNKYYDMVLMMISFYLDKDAIGRYSEINIEKIFDKIKEEINSIVKRFSGQLWFWHNNSGMFTFYFGDCINCATLASIYIFNQLFLIYIENLKLNKLIDFKISLHYGRAFYHKKDTENITSDMLNSIVHIQNQYAEINSLYITDAIYNSLSTRIFSLFTYVGEFEHKKIYRYNMQSENS